MSFQDINGRNGTRELTNFHSQATREVEGLVFQLTSAVAQLKKLVDVLGTHRDTVELRHRIGDSNQRIQDIAKQVKDRITALSEDRSGATPQQQEKGRKLLRDFSAILQDYKATQKLAADKEAASLPRVPVAQPAAAVVVDVKEGAGVDEERQALLQAQAQVQKQAQLMNNAIEYNDALIEERDHGIAEIQRQIGEVNEMFQDIAVLLADQGEQVITIDAQITSAAERTHEGGRELVKADRTQRATRNRCLIMWLVAALVLAIIIIVLTV